MNRLMRENGKWMRWYLCRVCRDAQEPLPVGRGGVERAGVRDCIPRR